MKRTMLVAILVMARMICFGQGDGSLDFVESGVTLRMTAPIKPDGQRKFFLEIQTNDVYECSNFSLENNARLEGTKLILGIKGVRRTNPCAPGMAPAKCSVDLTELKEGNYKVRLTINRQYFKAKLAVSDTSYDFRIGKEDPKLVRIYNGHLNIIPDNCIWGLSEYTDPKKKQEAIKFMAELEKAGAMKTQLPIGNYDEFYLHSPGTTEQKMIQGERYQFPFLYSFTGDTAVLQEVMNSFRNTLKITLKNAKGQVFTNF